MGRLRQVGVGIEDLLGQMTRACQKRTVTDQVSDFQIGHAALLGAHHVAWTAQFHVNFGDFEPVVRSAHCFQPTPGVRSQFRLGHQNAVALAGATPHASAQLVKLRQAKPLRTLNHHHAGVGHIHPHLDNSGRHQNLGLALGETVHFPGLVFRLHPAVHNGDLVLGHGKTANDAFVAVHQIFVVEGRALLNQRIHEVNLTAFGDLVFQKLKHPQPRRVGSVHGLDGLPARRQLVQHTGVQIAVRRHGQGSGYGGCRHHQDVRRDLRLLPKLGALGDPEAVLLVDDRQAKPVEHHLGFNQRVGPHQNVHLARLEGLQNLTPRIALHRPRQELHTHWYVA